MLTEGPRSRGTTAEGLRGDEMTGDGMNKRCRCVALLALMLVAGPGRGAAQTFRSGDPVIRRMWVEGMERSRLEPLAQVDLIALGDEAAEVFVAVGDQVL